MATLALAAIYYGTVDHIITYDAGISGKWLDRASPHRQNSSLQLAMCAAVYFAITYAADHKTRHLTRQVVSEIGSTLFLMPTSLKKVPG